VDDYVLVTPFHPLRIVQLFCVVQRLLVFSAPVWLATTG